ncbi:MAG: TatD family hydrolase, partial [Clostridiales Family XIII bacterium]|nr:TatD family hydrolase [Clostridiales Family XIII bacterium]
MIVLFDSHAHINNESYDDVRRAEVISAVENSDVGYVVDIGFNVESSGLAAAHAASYPWCYAAVGVHPCEVSSMTDASIETLRSLAAKKDVVAIGEIGLDYHYDDAPSADEQRYWFGRQLALGIELGMPVTIHDRESGGETLEILKSGGAFAASRAAAFSRGGAVGVGRAEDAKLSGSGARGDVDTGRGNIDGAQRVDDDGFPDARTCCTVSAETRTR